MSPVLEKIREKLLQNADAKLGFVVYRCTYDDDIAWKQFMNFLTTQAHEGLKDTGLEDMSSRLDWNVQENKKLLDGASFEVVREDFRHWIEEGHEMNMASPRHHACIVVDKKSLQSVLRWKPDVRARRSTNFDVGGSTWVYLLSKRDEGPAPDEEDEEDDDEHAENGLLGDEDEEAKDTVSYCRVGTSYLIPRMWELMEGPGWHRFAYQVNDRVVAE